MKYVVPRRNREFVSWPEVSSLASLLRRNRELVKRWDFRVLGLPCAEFRERCLEDLRAAAALYAERLNVQTSPLASPIVATGHQPEFCHAGVWIKNHLAARLAACAGGTSLNCIIDNDVPKHLGLLLPEKKDDSASAVEVPLMSPRPERAFEEYPSKLELIDAFIRDIARIAAGTPFEAAAAELASRVVRADGVGESFADVVTAVRVSYEREAGAVNAELPVSLLAATPAFGIFAASILLDAGRFARTHNAALAEYRRINRVRYPVNPVPDLAVKDDRIETPFWVWRRGEARGRLFVRNAPPGVTLLSEETAVASLAAGPFDETAKAWREIERSGWKIRPRALSTTLFLRLFASDIFIHGIGGAIYDEVTNAIARAFYGVEPSAFAVTSATLTIPWDFAPAERGDVARALRLLRDIDHNPDKLLAARGLLTGDAARLAAEKQALLAGTTNDRAWRRVKWECIREVNRQLAKGLEGERARALTELHRLRGKLAADEVLFGRDYCAFILGRLAGDFYAEVLEPLSPGSCRQ